MSAFRFYAYTDFEYNNFNLTPKYISLPITLVKPTKHTTDDIPHELNVPYTVFEILVAVFAIVGNLMVIVVFQRERKLRRRTNYYIVSLAIADLLVGLLGVPFAIMASIGLPTNLYACLFTVSLLVVLCTISIFCLLAVSVDRYWAILYPMAYSRTVRTRTAIGIISMCWFAGAFVGFLPLFGWHADVGPNQACLFVEVMDYDYLVFLYFATIITPALLMLAFYAHIYRVIVKQVRQIVTMNPLGDCSRRSSTAPIQTNTSAPSRPVHGGTMLRVLGAARKRDVKATQNLSIIVLFFMVCWFPLYTINCIKAFCPACDIHPKLTLFSIILSHLNSAVNPVLYAYHLKDFRSALKNLILKLIGVDVEQPINPIHRFSVASQNRLQSTCASLRTSTQPRLYIDSPVWLRQQQQKALTLNTSQYPVKCEVMTSRLNPTAAAVAAVTNDLEAEVWNIVEKTTAPTERNAVTFEMDKNHPQSSYSYNNHNFSNSPEETDFDEVFLPVQKDVKHDQPKSESTTPSELEISKQYSPTSRGSNSEEGRPLQTQLTNSGSSSSNPSVVNSPIFIVDNSFIPGPLSPNHKTRLKKQRAHLSKVVTKPISRSCSCTSDPPTPNHQQVSPNHTKKSSITDSFIRGDSVDSQGKTNHLTNNLNYYTIPNLSQQQTSSNGKFSPLKAMSQLFFPPVVKHSSLFQIFQTHASSDTPTLQKHSASTNTQLSPNESVSTCSTEKEETVKQSDKLEIK